MRCRAPYCLIALVLTLFLFTTSFAQKKQLYKLPESRQPRTLDPEFVFAKLPDNDFE